MEKFSLYSIPEILVTAIRVMNGEYGNDNERKKKLKKDGYNYNDVQECVNTIAKYWSD